MDVDVAVGEASSRVSCKEEGTMDQTIDPWFGVMDL